MIHFPTGEFAVTERDGFRDAFAVVGQLVPIIDATTVFDENVQRGRRAGNFERHRILLEPAVQHRDALAVNANDGIIAKFIDF